MGFLDLLKKSRGEKQGQEKPVEKFSPPLEEKILSLTAQGRASVVFNARKNAERTSFPGYSFNSIGRYIDGIVRGEDKEFVMKKCNLDLLTAEALDKIIEKEADKVLY